MFQCSLSLSLSFSVLSSIFCCNDSFVSVIVVILFFGFRAAATFELEGVERNPTPSMRLNAIGAVLCSCRDVCSVFRLLCLDVVYALQIYNPMCNCINV